MLNVENHSWTPSILLTSYLHLHSTFSCMFFYLFSYYPNLEIEVQGQAHIVKLGEPNPTKYLQDSGFMFASY